MHEVLVNRLGGLSLPRKSVVRLTDRHNMTLDVYHGRKTTIQPTKILSCIKGYILGTCSIFILTPCISNCWYLKVHFWGSEKVILKYKLSEMNFVSEISRVDCRRQKYSFSVYSVDNPLTKTRRSSYGRTALNS